MRRMSVSLIAALAVLAAGTFPVAAVENCRTGDFGALPLGPQLPLGL